MLGGRATAGVAWLGKCCDLKDILGSGRAPIFPVRKILGEPLDRTEANGGTRIAKLGVQAHAAKYLNWLGMTLVTGGGVS